MTVSRENLLAWQGNAADALLAALQKHGAALDASDLGTGKTAHALAVVRHLDVPTLVVCPAVSITGWKRMGQILGATFSIINYEALRTGNREFGSWENPRPKASKKIFRCASCQRKFDSPEELASRCPHHRIGIHCVEVKSKPHRYGKFRFHENIKLLVFDEVHRTSALDSLNADLLIASKRQGIPTIGASATFAEGPLDFRALGFRLGLHSLLDYHKWAFARGVRKFPLGGFHWPVGEQRKKEILAELHTQIFPERGCRVRIEDLGLAFPETQVTSELFDLKEAGRIDECYARMEEALAALEVEKLSDKCADHPLTALLRASQEIELLTVPVFQELASDALAQGMSVALFVNFRRTLDELCKRLKTDCRVDGSQVGERGAREREAAIQKFQTNESRCIVLTSAAGGVSISLHDERGGHPRLGLVSPGFSAVQFRQVLGRLRRATGKSKALYRIVLIAGTVQEKIHKALSGKLNNLDAILDSDLMAVNLPLTVGKLSGIVGDIE